MKVESDRKKPQSAESTQIDVVMYGLEAPDGRGGQAFHQIVTPLFRIGRHDSCNLVIWGDSKVSRRHALIHNREGNFTIEDNTSVNGTYVNDERIEATTPLQSGDRIRIGDQTFTFRQLG